MNYGFALRPAWLLSHALVVALVVTMVSLGFWQLRRHDERADRNALVEERADADALPLDMALGAADERGDLQFVRISATGTYDGDLSVLVANRTLDGVPGFWVMTPLRRDGPDLWVARGFVGRGVVAEQAADVLAVPADPVEVVGLLQQSAGGGVFAEGDRVAEVNRPDTALLSAPGWADGGDLGVYLQAESDTAVELVPIPPPPLDSGPHRSYAAQWFIFSLIAVVGYPLILRKAARDRATGAARRRAGTLTPDDAFV